MVDIQKESNKDSRNAPYDNPVVETRVEYRRRKVWGYWLVIILLAGACGVLGYALTRQISDARYFRRQSMEEDRINRELADTLYSLRKRINTVDAERTDTRRQLVAFREHVGKYYPMIINDVEFENVDFNGNLLTLSGNTLYANRIQYLKPTLKYEGLVSGTKKFMVKFFDPSGNLLHGSSSPQGYTYTSEYELFQGNDRSLQISGWGNNDATLYRPGTYRVEIWCDGKCLKTAYARLN